MVAWQQARLLARSGPLSDKSARIPFDRLFACPSCSASEWSKVGDAIHCAPCQSVFPIVDGIVDFIAGEKDTQLEVHEYDKDHAVDQVKIGQHFESLKAHTGTLFSRAFGNVLELGAGTGLLTAGLLRGVTIERLLVTDVSSRMLRACRDRLLSLPPPATTELVYATNDSVALGVRDGAFDLAIGYFVLHHVLDYEAALRSALAATGPDGIAVFVEPNLKFHQALFYTLGRVIDRMLLHVDFFDESDVKTIVNLHAEWNLTLKYHGDRDFASTREDKHLFDRAEFEDLARRSGWTTVATVPYGLDHSPLDAAHVYAYSMNLSPTGVHFFLESFASELPGPCSLLAREDAAASYVFILCKNPERLESLSLHRNTLARVPAQKPPMKPGRELHLMYDIELAFVPGEPPFDRIEGWIVSARQVMRIKIRSDRKELAVTVGLARFDVYDSLSRLVKYPRENALYSGLGYFRGLESASDSLLSDAGGLDVEAELDDGEKVVLASSVPPEKNAFGAIRLRLTRM